MCNAKALWDVIVEQCSQFFGSFSGDRVSPGAERDEQGAFFIKCHVAVHHRRKTEGGKVCDRTAVFSFYIC